jgi:hypothetical protein
MKIILRKLLMPIHYIEFMLCRRQNRRRMMAYSLAYQTTDICASYKANN